MNFIDIYKRDNNYRSNWTTDYGSTVFILGTIEPFTYMAEETDDEEVSWFIADQYVLDKLKTEISKL